MADKALHLNKKWCKGCGVCVGFCPKQVLKIEDNKCVIAYPEKCIHCGQCELRCPDNAIYIGGRSDEQ
ncbi:MAG TPA: 4Fe-4S binding protein [Tissierellia bacterium]|nr:4Fe-4S binding protein [Tissierellia bacterium]